MPKPLPANPSPQQLEKVQWDEHPPGAMAAGSASRETDQQNISLDICLGTTTMTVGEAGLLCKDQLVIMDQPAGDPVDIFREGTFLARGILVTIQGHFGVRITSLPNPATPPG